MGRHLRLRLVSRPYEYLKAERQRYAWVMRTYGQLPEAPAGEAADRRYPCELPGTPYRGMIFHDEAWHWAMLEIKGAGYTMRHPELMRPLRPTGRLIDAHAARATRHWLFNPAVKGSTGPVGAAGAQGPSRHGGR